jgi:hypothetical protein
LWLAEIGWRWMFGLGSLGLLGFSVYEFLASVHVPEGEAILLRSQNPWLIAGTLAEMLQEHGPRLLRAAAVLTPSLAILWIFCATVGRAATLRGLTGTSALRMRGLFGLSFLRAALALAAIMGVFGACLAAGYAVRNPAADSANPLEGVGLAICLMLLLSLLVGCVWGSLNWILSVACLSVAREGQDTFGAIGATVHLARRFKGPFAAISWWYGLLHLTALVLATNAGSITVILFPVSPAAAVITGLAITLLYLAAVDFLYVARLAAYNAVLESGEQGEPPSASPDLPATATSEPAS